MNILLKLLTILLVVVITYFLIGIATIIKNGTTIIDKPGTAIRLKTFFLTHLAETSTDSQFPELMTAKYSIKENASSDAIVKTILTSAEFLGYNLEQQSDKQLDFVVTTDKFNFKDDLQVFISTADGYLVINARSESRKGTADFGANIANIRNLFKEIDKHLE